MAGRNFSESVQFGVVKANLEKNNGIIQCELCGKQIFSIGECHFDHIVPYAKGGSSTLENCQILCVECNLKKSDKELVIRTYVVDDYTIENTVTATGTIQPLEQVEVGTQVSGEIDKIFVDYNSVVKKGQLLAELDKSNLLENLRQAEASVRSAESELEYSNTSFR